MWFILLVTCCTLISNVISAPTPQDFELPHFDLDSLGQGNLQPQGFSHLQRDSRQALDSSVARYFFEADDNAYKYT